MLAIIFLLSAAPDTAPVCHYTGAHPKTYSSNGKSTTITDDGVCLNGEGFKKVPNFIKMRSEVEADFIESERQNVCANKLDQAGGILDSIVGSMRQNHAFPPMIENYIAKHYYAVARSPKFAKKGWPEIQNMNPTPAQMAVRGAIVNDILIQYAREGAGLSEHECDGDGR